MSDFEISTRKHLGYTPRENTIDQSQEPILEPSSNATQFSSATQFSFAERKMLEAFAANEWFLRHHWPENRARVRQIAATLLERYPDRGASVLDVGCFNGYISLLAQLLGFRVTGSDAAGYADRDAIFSEFGIGFVESNLNASRPFAAVSDAAFDAIIFAEIFEHILNHPLGVLQELARVLKPGGLLVLTTPNPSTVANAARVLFDRHSLWGTSSFGEVQKFDEKGATCKADIHYREYRTCELTALLSKAGFNVRQIRYMGMGSPAQGQAVKRVVKKSCGFLFQLRLFANTQFIIATR